MLQLIPSIDAHHAWLTQPDPSGPCVRVRLYWHAAPLQTNLVQDLLRATAAQLVSLFDHWTLAPDRPWLTGARRLAGAGQLPIPPYYEPATHFAEYRRLLPAHPFRLEIGLTDNSNSSAAAALERTLSWLAHLLNPEVLVFVPDETTEVLEPAAAVIREPEIIAPPPLGKPHPLSPSEQKLAKCLSDDAALSRLFAFNRLVQISPFSQPCVDLLWADGKLVIEIDDSSHWRKEKYAADRQRDFELISAGFMILRITAEEALFDTPKAIEKIRTCVKLRGNQHVQ